MQKNNIWWFNGGTVLVNKVKCIDHYSTVEPWKSARYDHSKVSDEGENGNRRLHKFETKIHSTTGIWNVICIRAASVRKVHLNAVHCLANPIIYVYCNVIDELRLKTVGS